MDSMLIIGLLVVFFVYIFIYQRKFVEGYESVPASVGAPTPEQKKAQREAREVARRASDDKFMHKYEEIAQESLRQEGVTPSTSRKFVNKMASNGLGVVYEESPEGPYTKDPINDIDDYEVPNVYQLTTNREMNKNTINKLTAQYPLDWSGLPPNSSRFQLERTDYLNGVYNKPSPDESVFKALEGGEIQPPDQDALDAEEAKMLATYRPRKSPNMTTYSIEDADRLIKEIYKKKGLIPEIKRDPQNPNVYQVVGTMEINPKIVWEDQAPATFDALRGNGQLMENTVRVPAAAIEVASADPFFNTDVTQTRDGRSDYRQWTPGLERAFAPTYAKSSWY
jgi:hypothetical protein